MKQFKNKCSFNKIELFNKYQRIDSSISQHLYIISDDEIKEGDWFINLLDNSIHQATNWIYVSTCKKIIATTDTSLKITCTNCPNNFSECLKCTNDKLPQPSQQFIERFIESYNAGQVIDDVLVEYELSYEASKIIEHHINKIPKLKVDKNNTITIKKLKDSWNREEVIALLNKLNNTLNIVKESERGYQTLKEWIEKHL